MCLFDLLQFLYFFLKYRRVSVISKYPLTGKYKNCCTFVSVNTAVYRFLKSLYFLKHYCYEDMLFKHKQFSFPGEGGGGGGSTVW